MAQICCLKKYNLHTTEIKVLNQRRIKEKLLNRPKLWILTTEFFYLFILKFYPDFCKKTFEGFFFVGGGIYYLSSGIITFTVSMDTGFSQLSSWSLC